MPLPESALREQLHTRRIECRGYRREDGLWDIEGTLICLLYTSPSPRDKRQSRMPSSA